MRQLSRLSFVVLVCLCLASAGFGKEKQDNSAWMTDFGAALDKAALQKRFVVAFFHVPGAPICEKMQEKVFDLSPVNKALEDLIKVRVDVQASREYALLCKIQQVPAVIYFDSKGRELDRFAGYTDFRAFLRCTAEAIDPKTNYQLLKERLKANPGDIEALYLMGYKYTRRKDFDHADKYFKRVERLDPEDKGGFFDNIAVRRVEELERNGKFEEALLTLRDLIAKYPKGDEMEQTALLEAKLLWGNDKIDEAIRAYERFLKEYPESESRHMAAAALEAAKLMKMAGLVVPTSILESMQPEPETQKPTVQESKQ